MPSVEDKLHALMEPMLKKRLYVVWTEPTDKWPAGPEVLAEHLDSLISLERRRILFASGPIVDEATGKPTGPGLIVLRAESSAAAARIADQDPFHKGGFRRYRILPWQVNEGGLNVRVNFSDGTYKLD